MVWTVGSDRGRAGVIMSAGGRDERVGKVGRRDAKRWFISSFRWLAMVVCELFKRDGERNGAEGRPAVPRFTLLLALTG